MILRPARLSPRVFQCRFRAGAPQNAAKLLTRIPRMEPWSLTRLREKPIKIGAKVVSHGRHVTFQMAEVAGPRRMFDGSGICFIARARG